MTDWGRDDPPDAYAFYAEARRRELSGSVPDFAKAAGTRYFEKIEVAANTYKFWSIAFVPSTKRPGGLALLVRWGRIDTETGDSKLFEFIDDNSCLRAAAVRTAKKIKEGYIDRTPDPKRDVLGSAFDRIRERAPLPRREPDPYLPPSTDSAGFQIDARGNTIRNVDGWALDVRGRGVRPDEERRKRQAARLMAETPYPSPVREPPRYTPQREPAKPEQLAGDRVIDFEE